LSVTLRATSELPRSTSTSVTASLTCVRPAIAERWPWLFVLAMLGRRDLLEKIVENLIEERKRVDELAVDLGRRAADERLARLILNLRERLAIRGMVQDQTFEFPLRQWQIADATGLTPVHVSKVLGEFQKANLIEIKDRSLTILKPAELRRVADRSGSSVDFTGHRAGLAKANIA
jgi:CRP-like cAMP-binding protein